MKHARTLSSQPFRRSLDALADEARSIGLNDHAEVLEMLALPDDLFLVPELLVTVRDCVGPELPDPKKHVNRVPKSSTLVPKEISWT